MLAYIFGIQMTWQNYWKKWKKMHMEKTPNTHIHI